MMATESAPGSTNPTPRSPIVLALPICGTIGRVASAPAAAALAALRNAASGPSSAAARKASTAGSNASIMVLSPGDALARLRTACAASAIASASVRPSISFAPIAFAALENHVPKTMPLVPPAPISLAPRIARSGPGDAGAAA
jgi:hypothetical protein